MNPNKPHHKPGSAGRNLLKGLALTAALLTATPEANAEEKMTGDQRACVQNVLKDPNAGASDVQACLTAAKASKEQMDPVDKITFFKALESRFSKTPDHYKRPEGVKFADVKKALEAHPDLMLSLYKMEQTGGAPDVLFATDKEFIFADFSKESPDGRRDLTYDQSAEMAKKMGVAMISRDAYEEQQKSGKFDNETGSWLATSAAIRETGSALLGCRDRGDVYVDRYDAVRSDPVRGWRGVLRVPRS